MPLFFLLVGILLIVVAVNNKLPQLAGLLKEDFNPSDNSAGFHVWIVAIFVVGALGYSRTFRPVANAFLALIIISLILSNRGFFAKFSDALE